MNDFFDHNTGGGGVPYMHWPRRARALDVLYDLALRGSLRRRRIMALAKKHAPFKVLVVGIEVPSRPNDIKTVFDRLKISRHHIDTSVVPMAPRGKFENIEAAIYAAPNPLSWYDWLIIADDDIEFRAGFLDDFLSLSEAAGLAVSQPAHNFHSYASWAVTQRRWRSLARQTDFVEIGPLTALRACTFDDLVPFPPSRWCYGIDVYWSHLAAQRGWTMGVADGAPISHTRPIGGGYNQDAAIEEGRAFLNRTGITLSREQLFSHTTVKLRA